MHTIASVLALADRQLGQSGIESRRLDSSVLLANLLGISRAQLLMNPDKVLNNNEISEFEARVARRQQHEPVAYITGRKEFWSLDFCVTRDTLIPRSDSETLVIAALKRVQDRAKPITLLDIGTGTGCLLVALLTEFPQARGIGIDNNENALRVAEQNAGRHGVKDRAQFYPSHWCDAIDGTFDLILSNPPYIAEGAAAGLMADVVRYEPAAALFAGADGLDSYRALAPQMTRLLNKGGYVLFEVGEGQAQTVEKMLEAQGLKAEPAERDLRGVARCVVARKGR